MNKDKIQNKINFITKELKECDDNDKYERLWNERIVLKEELNELILKEEITEDDYQFTEKGYEPGN